MVFSIYEVIRVACFRVETTSELANESDANVSAQAKSHTGHIIKTVFAKKH